MLGSLCGGERYRGQSAACENVSDPRSAQGTFPSFFRRGQLLLPGVFERSGTGRSRGNVGRFFHGCRRCGGRGGEQADCGCVEARIS